MTIIRPLIGAVLHTNVPDIKRSGIVYIFYSFGVLVAAKLSGLYSISIEV